MVAGINSIIQVLQKLINMKQNFRLIKSSGAHFAVLMGLLSGCQTPDLKPFRESTARIHSSVVEAQDIYLDELNRLQPFVQDTSEVAKQSRRFTTNWTARIAVMDAVVRYAGSLAADRK